MSKREQEAAREHIEATLSMLREQVDELEKKLRARGTGDVREQAEAAVERVAPKPTLASRLEVSLRSRSLSAADLAREVGESVGRVSAALRALGAKVHNVGSMDAPRWTWVHGDEISTTELYALVERLLREQPMYLQEIVVATGARQNRINGILVRLQRDRRGVVNIGSRVKARWFALPPSLSTDSDLA